jgi:hypothetical protein
MKRICILGTPRSGSQYLANVMEKSFRAIGIDMCNLSEPFTFNKTRADMFPALSPSRQVFNKFGSTPTFNAYTHQSNYILSILSIADPTQSLILKYFMDDRGDINSIMSRLQDCGFEIILLKRNNIEHHLISWGAGCLTNAWDTTSPNYVPNLKMYFTKEILEQIQIFYNTFILKFNAIDITAPIVHYETLADDVERLFNITVDTNIKLSKQLNADPYTQITNADEVKEFIRDLIK